MVEIRLTNQGVAHIYEDMDRRLVQVRTRLSRPLTLSEKLLFGHLDDPETQDFEIARTYLS